MNWGHGWGHSLYSEPAFVFVKIWTNEQEEAGQQQRECFEIFQRKLLILVWEYLVKTCNWDRVYACVHEKEFHTSIFCGSLQFARCTQLPLYIIKPRRGRREGRWACKALTASTVGMGDCQAAAKYTLGSDSGSSSALSKPCLRFSDKRGFCLLKSSDSCDRGEVAGWGPLHMCVWRPDLSEVDRHSAMEGVGVVTEPPRH